MICAWGLRRLRAACLVQDADLHTQPTCAGGIRADAELLLPRHVQVV
jgi:hypothetical protein